MMMATNTPTPIPMDDRLLDLALEMKLAGLPWEPQVGCFVWDHQGFIPHPSPFPKRIYFILSMKSFFKIFGDAEQMKSCLVWLPTWYQLRQIMQRLNIGDGVTDSDRSSSQPSTPEEEMIRFYRSILQRLKAIGAISRGNRPNADSGSVTEWIRAVMASELGDLNWLPISVRHRIESVYSEVAGSYLGWRRIEEGRPEDWLPTETSFDTDLLRDLGHFFSDYQASVKWLERIRQAVLLLGAIDTRKDSENYDRLINLILEKVEPRTTQREILTQLTTHEDAPPG